MNEQEEFEFRLRFEKERAAKPEAPKDDKFSFVKGMGQQVLNAGAGALRGAGSIGATILTPYDLAVGNTKSIGNPERRQAMTDALGTMGADTNSLAFNVGKIGGEVAGTAGMGGVLANTAARIPGVAAAAPNVLNALRTSGFTAGNATGMTGLGVRTLGGAATGGVSAGLADPTDAGYGALIGGATPTVVRGAAALGRGTAGLARGLSEPFTASGRSAIAGRTLQRFGVTPQDVQGLTDAPTITGARQSLAEQITRPEGAAGAARLQDAVRSLDPQISASMAARETENNAARVSTLRDLAGQDGARDFAAAHRSSTAQQQYERAFSVPVNAEDLSPAMRGEATKIMNMPAVREAVKEARLNAANFGMKLTGNNSIAGMHQAKLAMDDAISRLSSGGAVEANKAAGIKAARDRMVTFMEKMSPDYKDARTTYAEMSRPVNQMDVAGELLNRGGSNTSDLAGNTRLMPNALTGAMSDEALLIKRATGRNAGNSLESLMEPGQLNRLRAVVGEVDRGAAVARAGAGPGSPTAQRMASTNLLSQMGLPESVTNNALVQTLMRPVQFGANIAEPRIQQTLLEIIQSPALAADAMRRATPTQRIALQRAMQQAAQAGIRVAPVIAAQ